MAEVYPAAAGVPPPPELPPAPPAGPQQVLFALNPGERNSEGVLDYSNKEDKKYYYAATKPLSEELYDCNPEDLIQFLNSLRDRSADYGWYDGIMEIPDEVGDHLGETTNLIDNYGSISLEHIKANERTCDPDQ
jgi:hypothetical protein